MSDMSKDEEFQNEHEIPDSLAFEPSGSIITFKATDGKEASLYQVSSQKSAANYLFMIHEWWGLNDYIKQEAEKYAEELGVTVYALDLYDGKVAETRDSAAVYMQATKKERAEAIIQGALALTPPEANVATIGWCFGGGWSLNSAILGGDKIKGCVIYYGMPTDEISELKKLKTDVLGIFAKDDKWINPEVVEAFGKNMEKAGKKSDNHIFDADHAFANPSSPRYKETPAKEARKITLDYLNKKFN